MSLPAFLAAIIGGSVASYGAGALRRSNVEKHEADQFALKMLQEGVMKGLIGGGDVPYGAVEKAIGPARTKQLWPLIQTFKQGQLDQQQQATQRGMDAISAIQKARGGGGPPPDYFGQFGGSRAGVEPLSPEQQAAFGTPQQPGQPPALPAPGGPATGAQPGAPTTPQVAPGPALQPSPAEPSGFAPPGQFPMGGAPTEWGQAPQAQQPRLATGPRGPLRPPPVPVASQALGETSVHVDTSDGKVTIRVGTPTQTERITETRSNILAQARPGVVSPRHVQEVATAHGAPLTPEQFKMYGDQDYFIRRPSYIGEQLKHSKKSLVTPEVERAAARAYAEDHGHAPDKAFTDLFTNQADVNAYFLDTAAEMRQNPAARQMPVAQVLAGYASAGVHPDETTVKMYIAQRRQEAELELQRDNPLLAKNPAAWLRAIQDQVGSAGLSENEREVVRSFAPSGKEATEQQWRGGKDEAGRPIAPSVPTLMADIPVPGAKPVTRPGQGPGPSPLSQATGVDLSPKGQVDQAARDVVTTEQARLDAVRRAGGGGAGAPAGKPAAPQQPSAPAAAAGAPTLPPPAAPPAAAPTRFGSSDEAYRYAKAEQARDAQRQSQAQTAGTEEAKRLAAPNVMVSDPVQLQRYVDQGTFRAAEPATQGEINDKVRNRKLFIIKDRDDLQALAALEGYIKRFRHNLDVLKDVKSAGGAAMLFKSSLVTGINEPIWGLPVVPGGVLPTGWQDAWIKHVVAQDPKMTTEKAREMADAMVDMNALFNDAPLVFRQMGQRGNVPGHLVTRETRSLPVITENDVISEQKYRGFVAMVDQLWKGLGMDIPKRDAKGFTNTKLPVYDPQGVPGTLDLSLHPNLRPAPSAPGQKPPPYPLPPGFRHRDD